jgi:hypothetical protein
MAKPDSIGRMYDGKTKHIARLKGDDAAAVHGAGERTAAQPSLLM